MVIIIIRGSNLLCPSVSGGTGPYTLPRGDVTVTDTGLLVTVHSSKTLRIGQGVTLTVPMAGGTYWPVHAWRVMCAKLPSHPLGPAFVLPSGKPLTNSGLSAFMRRVLGAADKDNADSVSVHGMRRGSSRAAVRQGSSVKDVKNQGTWKGNSVYTYVPKEVFSDAPGCIAAAFGSN